MQNLIIRLKALSDSNRFRIVMMLMERPLCVCEMLDVLDISGGTLSNHLKILMNAQLLVQKKEGRWIVYSIKGDSEREFLEWLSKECSQDEVLRIDAEHVKSVTPLICSSSLKNRKYS